MVSRLIQISLYVSVALGFVWLLRKVLVHYVSRSILSLLFIPLVIQLCIPFQVTSRLSAYRSLSEQKVYVDIQEKVEEINRMTNPLPPIMTNEEVISSHKPMIPFSNINIITLVYLLGLVGIILYDTLQLIQFSKEIKDSSLENEALVQRVKQHWYNQDITICIVDCSGFHGAALWGVLRPKLLVSNELAKLNEESLSYVIRHEKVHYQKHHLLIQRILYVLHHIYWFNPFIQIGLKLIKEELEYLCDSAMLENLSVLERKNYAETLLLTISEVHRMEALSLSSSSKKKIKERIKNIMDNKKNRPWTVGVIAILICVISMGMLSKPKVEMENVTLQVPLSYHNFNADNLKFEIENENNLMVEVEVTLPKSELSSAKAELFEAYVDFEKASEGKMEFPIELTCEKEPSKYWQYEMKPTMVVFSFTKDVNVMEKESSELSFRLPVDNPRITCNWGCYAGHKAVDVLDSLNEYGNVYAVEEGIVLENDYNNVNGYYIRLQVSKDTVVQYNHLKTKSPWGLVNKFLRGKY